jgi:hypothetical protein
MNADVVLRNDQAEDALRMLTALSAVLREGLPPELFATLEPAIGPEIVRFGNPVGVHYLADRADQLRKVLVEALDGRLLDEHLAR